MFYISQIEIIAFIAQMLATYIFVSIATSGAAKQSYRLRDRGDLETKYSDMEDFIILPIWEIKEILIAAFILGKERDVRI